MTYHQNASSQSIASGGKAVKPKDLTADGYTFGGWYKEAECKNVYDFNTSVAGNITLYAKWNKSVAGVNVTPDSVTLTKAGETSQIKAAVTPSDAANTKVSYQSSDTRVATVDENGKVTAVANGTANITVTTEDGAKTATVKVTVKIPSESTPTTNPTTEPTTNPTTEPTTNPTTEPITNPVEEPTKEEKAVISMNAGLKITQTGSKIKIKWGKVKEADGYEVYVSYCGKKFAKPIKVIKKNSTTTVNVTKLNGKKIDLKKNFKVYVAAYKTVDGKNERLAKTITGHVVGRKNVKYTNAKAIKLSKKKLSVKVGKTAKVKAKTVLVDKTKKQLTDAHATEFRYASSNKNIATVDKKGKVKGIAKGTCTIYVYARNGYAKTVKITVK